MSNELMLNDQVQSGEGPSPQLKWRWQWHALALALGFGLIYFGWQGLPAQVEVLCGLLFYGALAYFAGAMIERQAWNFAPGPLLYYDLLVTARKGRYILLRCLYAAVLLASIFLLYADWFGIRLQDLFSQRPLQMSDLPRFGSSFYHSFMVTQLAVVLLFTPLSLADAIAGEKQSRTLEYLLTTPLTNREIILGKLLSRLAHMVLLILTGLPVLAFMQLLGGIDPNRLLAGYAMTGATLLSLGALSLAASVHSDKTLDAIALSYLWVVFYLLSYLCPCVSPVMMFGSLSPFGDVALPIMIAVYIAIHVTIAAGAIFWSLKSVRSSWEIKRQTAPRDSVQDLIARFTPEEAAPEWCTNLQEATVEPKVPVRRRHPRPPMGDHPLLWKELHAEQDFSVHKIHPTLAALGIVTLGGVLVVFALSVLLMWSGGRPIAPMTNFMVRALGMVLSTTMLVAVAFAASASVTREREQGTLMGLLTLPIAWRDIVFSKWLGSILSVRWLTTIVVGVVVLGILTGGLHITASLSLVVLCLVHAAFLAGLGLRFSIICRNNMQASLWTLGTILTLWGGSWLLGQQKQVFAMVLRPQFADWICVLLETGGPFPASFLALAVPASPFEDEPWRGTNYIVAALIGVLVYALAAAWLWWSCLRNFHAMKGPKPLESLSPQHLRVARKS